MSDEITKIVLGDTAISSIERGGSRERRLFRRRKSNRPPLIHCENCGAQLHGHWCAQCGQPAIDYRRSIRHVLADVLNEFLNWDSKFFATIGLLIAKPWRLTNQFLGGHRVRYVHPLRLYLLASILFFFAVNGAVKSVHFPKQHLSPKDRARVEAKLAAKNLTPEQREKVEKALNLANVLPEKTALAGALAHDQENQPSEPPTLSPPPVPDVAAKTTSGPPVFKFDEENPNSPLGKWLEKRAKEKIGEYGTNAELFFRALVSNLPYMVTLLHPALRPRAEDSLHPTPNFLHRSSGLRVAHS